jgi:ubiquinone/menaquinone biosynthesis C-methylase UbiE
VDDQKRAIKEMLRVCKNGGKVSILVPKLGFSDDELESLCHSLGVSNFSKAALKTWHKRAPKMSPAKLDELLSKAGVTLTASETYLDGMVLSVSGVKSLRSLFHARIWSPPVLQDIK